MWVARLLGIGAAARTSDLVVLVVQPDWRLLLLLLLQMLSLSMVRNIELVVVLRGLELRIGGILIGLTIFKTVESCVHASVRLWEPRLLIILLTLSRVVGV